MTLLKPFQLTRFQVVAAMLIMALAVGSSQYLKPTRNWTEVSGVPHYEQIVPTKFGNWEALPYGARAVVNPAQEEALMKLYTETFARSYVHKPTGRVLMLSIAYGKDQSSDTQIHAPEACYRSQGFRVQTNTPKDIQSPFGPIKAVQLETSLGPSRAEPLTYFIRVGNQVARGSRERNLARLDMALKGYLVDGMLFRVSEITRSQDSHSFQEEFIGDLLKALDGKNRAYCIGERGA